MKIIATLALALATAGMAFAGLAVAAPEIDPASSVAALALLSGGLIVIRARKRK